MVPKQAVVAAAAQAWAYKAKIWLASFTTFDFLTSQLLGSIQFTKSIAEAQLFRVALEASIKASRYTIAAGMAEVTATSTVIQTVVKLPTEQDTQQVVSQASASTITSFAKASKFFELDLSTEQATQVAHIEAALGDSTSVAIITIAWQAGTAEPEAGLASRLQYSHHTWHQVGLRSQTTRMLAVRVHKLSWAQTLALAAAGSL